MKHGHAVGKGNDRRRHPLYARWVNIRQRTGNPNHPRFADYGGRGITCDPRWADFAVFLADVGEPPGGSYLLYSIDRCNNDGPYAWWNVRWSTRAGQRRNKYREPWPFGALVKDHERDEEEHARTRAEVEGWADGEYPIGDQEEAWL